MTLNQQTLSFIIPVLLVLPLLYLRLRRMMKPQRFKPSGLWVRPAIMLFAAVALLAASPPAPASWIWFALAALLGGAGGWYWGKLTRLHIQSDGTLMMTGSQAGMIVLVVLLVLRIGMRAGIGMEAQAMHWDAALLTDIFIVFAALLFAVRGLEIFLRARAVLKGGDGAA